MSTQVTMTGNLTSDPTMRVTKTGSSILSMGIAVTRRWRDKQDNWEEQTSFFDVTAFGDLADNAAASLGKGAKVVVVGRMEQQEWQDKNDGSTKKKIVVIADDVAISLRRASVDSITKNPTKCDGQFQKAGYTKAPSSTLLAEEEPF
jgi:single-strand DNA-binding protein